MLQVENMPELILKPEDAAGYFNQRTYSDTVVKVRDCVVEFDGFKVGNTKHVMTDTFVDALFGVTKLPRANEKVLPTDNVVADINTILQSGSADTEYLLRMVDGKAYSLFPIKDGVIKRPMNHQEFLDAVRQSVDEQDIKNIHLSKKFLRVSTFDENVQYEVAVGDPHHFGIDFVNGETFKGYPLTAAAMLYRLVCSNGAVAPFENKMVKFKVSDDIEALKKRFIDISSGLTVDNEMMLERLRKLAAIDLNEGLVEYVCNGTKFMPLQARENIFAPFYEQDVEGHMTKALKENSCQGLKLYDLYNRVTLEAHTNPEVGQIHRYKAECFAGTLLNENNKDVRKLIGE